jgi:hypothetical protein
LKSSERVNELTSEQVVSRSARSPVLSIAHSGGARGYLFTRSPVHSFTHLK